MTAAFPPLWGLMPAPPIHLRTWQNRKHVTKDHTLWPPVFIKRIFFFYLFSPCILHFQPIWAKHFKHYQRLHGIAGEYLSIFALLSQLNRWAQRCQNSREPGSWNDGFATPPSKRSVTCTSSTAYSLRGPWRRSFGLVISIWDKQLEGYDGFVSYQTLFYSRFLLLTGARNPVERVFS